MRQITRISPCVLTGEYDDYNNPLYGYSEEIIVGADALRFRNGEGENAVCVGKNTTATADCSFAAGENSKAIGYCSFALGYNVETNNNYSFVCGHDNDPGSLAIFAIGCGSPDKKNNAITVYDKCKVNGISYSTGDTVINGVTAYANGKVEIPGITANTDKSLDLTGITINSDGTVSIPKLSQLDNYATVDEVRNIYEAHNSLFGEYKDYVKSNNQAISMIHTNCNANNNIIKNYAKSTLNVNKGSTSSMMQTIIGLFTIIGESIDANVSGKWTKSLRSSLNNGTQELMNRVNEYLNNITTATSTIEQLKNF